MKRIVINILSIIIAVLFCNFAVSCNLKNTTGSDSVPIENRTNSYSEKWAHISANSIIRVDTIDETNPDVYPITISIKVDTLDASEYSVSVASVSKQNNSSLELQASDFELTSGNKELTLTQSGLNNFKTHISDLELSTLYQYRVTLKFTTASDKVQEKEVAIPIPVYLNKLKYVSELQFEEVLQSVSTVTINDSPNVSINFADSSYWLADYPNFYEDMTADTDSGIINLSSDNAGNKILSAIQNSAVFSKYFSKVEYLKGRTHLNGDDLVLYFKFHTKGNGYIIPPETRGIEKYNSSTKFLPISVQIFTPEGCSW